MEDFINGKVTQEQYPKITDLITQKKQKYIDKLNQDRKNIVLEDGTNIIKEGGGKNHRKYRKIDATKIEDEHLIMKDTGHTYILKKICKKGKKKSRQR